MYHILFFFFNDTATTEIYTYCHTLSLHDALPISLFKRDRSERGNQNIKRVSGMMKKLSISAKMIMAFAGLLAMIAGIGAFAVFKIGEVNDLSAQMRTRWLPATQLIGDLQDRKSTRLNSSH